MVGMATRPRAQGYRARIGDDWFRVAPSTAQPISVYSRDSLAPRSDDRGSPEENVLDLGYAFSRSNLTGGEGLDYYPRQGGEDPRERDTIRFWDSGNLVIERPDAGEPYALRLAHEEALFWNPAATAVDMGQSSASLWVAEGTNVHRFDDLTDTTPNNTENIGTTIVQLAVNLDGSVAALTSNGHIWYKGAKTDTFLDVYDPTVDGPMLAALAIWSVKGRILFYCQNAATAAAGQLVELAPVIQGTPAAPTEGGHTYTTIDTLDATVLSVVDAQHAIVACCSDGSLRSYVPQTDTAGGVPDLTIRARSQVPIGETPYLLAWNLGTLLVFTADTNRDHLRVYSAEVLDERFDYVVGPLQLRRTWTNTTISIPAYTQRVVGTRDAIYFWVAEEGPAYNLWRFDLVSLGLFREHKDELSTQPTGLSVFEDSLLWLRDGDVYRETDTYKESGYLITPNITFGLNTSINWISFVLEATGLQTAGVRVEMYRSTSPEAITDPDHPTWVLVQTITDQAQSGQEQARVSITSNTLALQIKLWSSENSLVTAEVQRFSVRGYPKHRDWIAEVPINISDYVEVPGRMPLHVPGLGDAIYTRLSDLQGTSSLLTLLDPPTMIRGVFDNILTPVRYVTDRGSQGVYAVAVFRGTRITDTSGASVSTGSAGMGVGVLGVSTMGVGQAT